MRNDGSGFQAKGKCVTQRTVLKILFSLLPSAQAVCPEVPWITRTTLNLPKTDFPMKANLAKKEPETLDAVGADPDLRQDPRGLQGPPDLHPARRPPLRQRPHPPRHCPQQDPQGHHRQVEEHGGLRQLYVPGWDCHGLPIEHQVDKELGAKKARMSQAEKRALLPQVRREVHRHPAGRVQAARRLRRVGQPLPDHELTSTRRSPSAEFAQARA